jgi:hypothetical protein
LSAEEEVVSGKFVEGIGEDETGGSERRRGDSCEGINDEAQEGDIERWWWV